MGKKAPKDKIKQIFTSDKIYNAAKFIAKHNNLLHRF